MPSYFHTVGGAESPIRKQGKDTRIQTKLTKKPARQTVWLGLALTGSHNDNLVTTASFHGNFFRLRRESAFSHNR